MKNHNRMKMNEFKTASPTPSAGTPSPAEECCPCCRFLKGWLARRNNRSKDDLAAALLIYLLWVSRNSCKDEGLCGLGFQAGDLDSLGIAVPDEALKGLQILAKAGLVTPYLCRGEPINTAEARSRVTRRPVTLVVDLLWLNEHQK